MQYFLLQYLLYKAIMFSIKRYEFTDFPHYFEFPVNLIPDRLRATTISRLKENILIIHQWFQSFLEQNLQTFAGSSFLNVRIHCFSLSVMINSSISLWVLDCWLNQKRHLKMSLWVLGNCDDHFPPVFGHFIVINRKKKNNCQIDC